MKYLPSGSQCQISSIDGIIYNDVIMGSIASQITSLAIVYSAFYSGADQRKHQSSTSLAVVRGIHRRLVNSPHKWPVTWKMFPFDDVIMGLARLTRAGSLGLNPWGLNQGAGGLLQTTLKLLAFTGPMRDFADFKPDYTKKSFTGPTHFLSANVWGPVSLLVSAS